jgi:hypothetical protein
VLGAQGYFVIADKSDRDLAIARQRRPELPAATVAVTDVSAWGHPMLRADEAR